MPIYNDYNINMNVLDEVANVAELLFLRAVCSHDRQLDAARESDQNIEYDDNMVNWADKLIYTVFRLCDSILYSDDPMTALEASGVMGIRLSHAEQPDDEMIGRIQNAVRRSFVDALECLHTIPKLQPELIRESLDINSILQFQRDLNVYIPVLTQHMGLNFSLPTRIFKAFHSSLSDIAENQSELLSSTGMLSCYQPEIAIFVLLALQYRRFAMAMVARAQNDNHATMVEFLYYDSETRSVLTYEVLRNLAPLFIKYLQPAVSIVQLEEWPSED